MHARVTRLMGAPDKLEEARSMIEGEIIPEAKGLSGFINGYWMVDRSSGEVVTVTLWDTEANLIASEEGAAKVRDHAAERTGGSITSVDRYEVIAQA
jgi:heme-degrading monooxygenase HmoA